MPVNPSREQLAAISDLAGSPQDGPLVMLNLNRYRDRAAYAGEVPGGDSPDVSGHEAYARYSAVALRVLGEVGGSILWFAPATMTVIGEPRESWDEVIAVRYPSAQAFVGLATHPDILPALPHRDAGLERAALVRCDPGQVERNGG